MKRRDFLKKSIPVATAATAMPYLLNGFPVHAHQNSALLNAILTAGQTGRALVIIQVDGGNDGLNTLIPYENSLYYQKRPTLGIKKSDALRLSDTLGWHPRMTEFDRLYKEGKLAVLQNVGYTQPNRSHFRSTDIWFTGSDSNQVLDTGWLGRYLDFRYPGYPATAPASPLAIQIGTALSLALQGPNVGMGMALTNIEQFYQLIQGTDPSGGEEPPQTRAGDELRYIRQITGESIGYATPIRETFNSVSTKATYPAGNLSEQLKIVARLLAGSYQGNQMETPVYIVRWGGFDTHANQITSTSNVEGAHANLLAQLSGAVGAFLQDCKLLGCDDRVLVMTVSEFGRRVNENGTLGTDHGTAAPQFVIGNAVKGGIFGKDPDLSKLDGNQDLIYEIEYRQMYASVLEQWFGVKTPQVKTILDNKDWTTYPIITPLSVGVRERSYASGSFSLEQNYPNPFNPSTRIRFNVKGGDVVLKIFDTNGREVRTLVNSSLQAGEHEILFNANGLPSGTYVYRLHANGMTETKSMMLVK